MNAFKECVNITAESMNKWNEYILEPTKYQQEYIIDSNVTWKFFWQICQFDSNIAFVTQLNIVALGE